MLATPGKSDENTRYTYQKRAARGHRPETAARKVRFKWDVVYKSHKNFVQKGQSKGGTGDVSGGGSLKLKKGPTRKTFPAPPGKNFKMQVTQEGSQAMSKPPHGAVVKTGTKVGSQSKPAGGKEGTKGQRGKSIVRVGWGEGAPANKENRG